MTNRIVNLENWSATQSQVDVDLKNVKNTVKNMVKEIERTRNKLIIIEDNTTHEFDLVTSQLKKRLEEMDEVAER